MTTPRDLIVADLAKASISLQQAYTKAKQLGLAELCLDLSRIAAKVGIAISKANLSAAADSERTS